jgi:hypothetical protein
MPSRTRRSCRTSTRGSTRLAPKLGSLRATGQAVTDAVVAKSMRAKAEINAAYNAARESGAMQERIDAAPLQQYLAEHQAEAINAPILTSVEAKLKGIADKSGTVSINDLEEVRKMVGKLSGKDATNAVFGKDVKNLIDGMTEGKGGQAYQKARGLRTRYAQEFEDHAVVDRLLSFKPGTKDRAVAYEDVFDHTILKGSLDDVRTIRKGSQTAGPREAGVEGIAGRDSAAHEGRDHEERADRPSGKSRGFSGWSEPPRYRHGQGREAGFHLRQEGCAADQGCERHRAGRLHGAAGFGESLEYRECFDFNDRQDRRDDDRLSRRRALAVGAIKGELKNAKMRAKVKDALK